MPVITPNKKDTPRIDLSLDKTIELLPSIATTADEVRLVSRLLAVPKAMVNLRIKIVQEIEAKATSPEMQSFFATFDVRADLEQVTTEKLVEDIKKAEQSSQVASQPAPAPTQAAVAPTQPVQPVQQPRVQQVQTEPQPAGPFWDRWSKVTFPAHYTEEDQHNWLVRNGFVK